MAMNIYIPTLQRVGRQRTLRFLPEELRKRTWLVCPLGEVKAHKKEDCNILPCPERGIHNVRQWILEHAKTEVLFMLDDDLMFFRRKRPTDWHLRTADQQDILELFTFAERLLHTGYVHVGLSMRQDNDRQVEAPYVLGGRQCMAYGFVVPALKELGVRFRTRLMSDFEITLQLLDLGYINAFITEWCVGQVQSQSKGGCSVYRTHEMLADAAKELRRLHPQSISIKLRRADWVDIGERFDVQVAWQKTWMNSIVKHGDHTDPVFVRRLAELRKEKRGVGIYTRTLLEEHSMVIYEYCKTGKIRKRPFTVAAWEHSKKDRTVLAQWTAIK